MNENDGYTGSWLENAKEATGITRHPDEGGWQYKDRLASVYLVNLLIKHGFTSTEADDVVTCIIQISRPRG